MGFEKNGVALFLKMRHDGVKFGRVLTLGHQNIHMDLIDYLKVLKRLGLPPASTVPEFADPLLLAMGAEKVEAMDFSTYEGAALVHDLNQPIPSDWHEQYDVVFDGGTLEHVFHFPTALKNCMQMVKKGGRLVAVTMTNNFCGHGFYQFSPELFFRALSPANGFSVVELYLARLNGEAYLVRDPESVRSRVELCNSEPMLLLLHARRDEIRPVFEKSPQQSDYVAEWNSDRDRAKQAAAAAAPWKNYPVFRQLRRLRWKLYNRRVLASRALSNQKFYTLSDLSL